MIKRELSPNYKLVLRELSFGPATAKDVAEAVKIDKKNVARHLYLAQELKQARIVAWLPRQVPVWAQGPGPNKRKPPALTGAEKSKNYRQRKENRGPSQATYRGTFLS